MVSYPVDGGDLNPIHLVYTAYRGQHFVMKLRSISGIEAGTEKLIIPSNVSTNTYS
jgi:hypothetical protein